MSDLISRSALLEYGNARTIKEAVGNWDELDGKAKAAVLRYAIKIKTVINHAPAVDAVEVVRCRECKWFKPYQKPVEDFDGRCVVHMCETDEEEYCSIGRRKDNG